MPDGIMTQALDYTRRGWHVFPCREQTVLDEDGQERFKAKAPYIGSGFKEATTDEAAVREWWRRWPNALIGVSTGPSGLLVIDLDNKHGIDGAASFAEVCAAHGGVPRTFTVRTQSGGRIRAEQERLASRRRCAGRYRLHYCPAF